MLLLQLLLIYKVNKVKNENLACEDFLAKTSRGQTRAPNVPYGGQVGAEHPKNEEQPLQLDFSSAIQYGICDEGVTIQGPKRRGGFFAEGGREDKAAGAETVNEGTENMGETHC